VMKHGEVEDGGIESNVRTEKDEEIVLEAMALTIELGELICTMATVIHVDKIASMRS
jgi:hypothetical protein